MVRITGRKVRRKVSGVKGSPAYLPVRFRVKWERWDEGMGGEKERKGNWWRDLRERGRDRISRVIFHYLNVSTFLSIYPFVYLSIPITYTVA